MKKIHLGVLLFLFAIVNSSAQTFYGPTTTTSVAAQEVGEPNTANYGTVETATAPLGPDNRVNARAAYQTAGIPNSIIDLTRFLGNGTFARQISDMWATKQTANNVRKVTSVSANLPAASSNVIYIDTRAELDANRANIASNANFTFVFQGWINPGWPIRVGSNTTIWVDGTLNYDGHDAPRTATGADFTPRPSKYDGVFNIRPEGTFLDEPTSAANVTSNKNLISDRFTGANSSNYAIEFVNIYGTRNGLININQGNYTDPDGQVLPQVNGITIMNASKVNIEGVTIKNSFQGIFLAGNSHRVNFRNNFIDNTLYRAIHLKGAWNPSSYWGNITNNLITLSKFDGIDLDSYASGFQVTENVIIGARDRLLIWTEIDANNNIIDNNVGILLDAATEGTPFGNAGKGAFQENGTESERNPASSNYDGSTGFNGNSYNQWLNNHSFYAASSSRGFDGFVMRKDRYIQFNTITFTNNYVWTTDANITKHNPKYGVNNDVYYLTASNTNSNFYIVNRQTGKKIRPFTDAEGSSIVQVDPSLTGDYVRWEEVPTSDGYFYLKNVQTGMYFRPSGDNDGDYLEQRPTSYSGYYTQWKKVNTSESYFYLQNRQTGQYFRPNSDANDSQLQQRPTSYGGNYTQWIFQDTNSNSTQIAPPNSLEEIKFNANTTEAYSKLIINMPQDSPVLIYVFDITGNTLISKTYNLEKGNNSIELPNLSKGIYIAKILYNGEVKTIKFLN